ncbi:putative membrane protein YfcA [Virgibacillus halotolerans]|uniref:sulfite exporter TauE/SafE family protein n=1 Tax=Virgibacillus halotolerans TaxID=1071053 RepID=UPI001960D067|nr:sulfite exporter TauE/SafE family protein [Virgibacillus halotolerans]MBM7599094.1 putative membrane protein YfcA [Virgibacillus halotolerans]
MDITIIFFLLIIGIIAGGYGTIVGAGGGFIFVPALLLLLKVEPAVAAGSGLVIVLINSLSGVVGYTKQNKINYRVGILIGIGALPGSFLGVWLLQVYASDYFYIVFATVLMLLGIFLFAKNLPFSQRIKETENQIGATHSDLIYDDHEDKIRIKAQWLIPLGFLMGVLSSYLGIGGGWLLVPILIYLFKMPTHFATATSIFSLCIYSSFGVISQIFYSNIDWTLVAWGGVGIIIGSQLGVLLAQKIPGKIIMQMLSFLLIIIGFRMYFG